MRFVPCMRSWHNLDHLPFDDGVCLPFGIPSQKGGVFVEFLFLGGEFIFCCLELVELFRLYLDGSLCTLPF